MLLSKVHSKNVSIKGTKLRDRGVNNSLIVSHALDIPFHTDKAHLYWFTNN